METKPVCDCDPELICRHASALAQWVFKRLRRDAIRRLMEERRYSAIVRP
jgi:hypothetical protein